jgi:hypothetical protein
MSIRKTLRIGHRLSLLALSLFCVQTVFAEDEQLPQNPATQESWMTADSLSRKPHWSLEIKGGKFEPKLAEWETFYGDDHTKDLAVALSYKVLRRVEVGVAIDSIKDEGVGTLPLNDTLGGEVKFNMYPAHVYVLARGLLFENQWVVPYIGGGITRAYYRQKIENQNSVRGKADGSHVRAGLQILLDQLDEGNAAGFEDENVENTYLVIEAVSFSAKVDEIELGGKTLTFGFIFEF